MQRVGDDNKEVLISVKDPGQGINPEILPKLYKVCYKIKIKIRIRNRHRTRVVHIKKYCRRPWWKDMG
jgi:hypothetical protein